MPTTKLTKIELVQINSRLASENEKLRAELSKLRTQLESTPKRGNTFYVTERPSFKAALAVLKRENPDAKSFSQEVVMHKMEEIKNGSRPAKH